MRIGLLVVLFFVPMVLFGQDMTVKDSVTSKKTYNGLYRVTAILVGQGQYSQLSSQAICPNLSFKEEYVFGHFYADAGLGLYYMPATVVSNPAYMLTTTSTEPKFLLEVPLGVGFTISAKRMIIRAGIDVPYLLEVNLTKGENGWAVSPYYAMTWDSKKKKSAMGFILKATSNLQKSATDVYNPGFYGIGFLVRGH